MKNIRWQTLITLIAVLLITAACSDITDTQRKYLDRGETSYVGRMDSVVALGGKGRVVILAKNTYLRTATKCIIKWVDYQGATSEKTFTIKDCISGDYTRMTIDSLPEGDYDFYVYNMDDWGNKSLTVDCHGSSYGDTYASIQPKIAVSSITVDDNNTAQIIMTSSKMAVKYRLTYQGDNNEEKTIEVNSTGGKITIPNWGDFENLNLKVTTYILPSDKAGIDTLVLPEVIQTAKQTTVDYDVDKSRIVPMVLTKNDDPGTSYGAKGVAALFDNTDAECWGLNVSAPGHFCFDLGVKAYLSGASIVGRLDYPGWDVVKFEIWGRESIDDGAYGSTGYYIMSTSRDKNFVKEATTRKWKKVGNGWFKYTSPRSNPQVSKCVLTEVDHSFKPRYILFRVMSVLTPDIVPVPDTQYFGNEGGFYSGDGVNTGNRAFCIRELNLKALGMAYTIQNN
ncbi:MAG: DUF4998 domain-containing protein [Bacteroidota bacterium]|nr:DUF4998 domain-containing protein [Bacteroidota bacterium]